MESLPLETMTAEDEDAAVDRIFDACELAEASGVKEITVQVSDLMATLNRLSQLADWKDDHIMSG
jgi:hypothetical protein